ncbi:MAG: prephenate dehydratase [Planctomycetota bacterium]
MGEPTPAPNDHPRPLDELRQKIDDVDASIVRLLNQRARLVVEVGQVKRQNNARFYAPSRESEVFRRACERSDGPLPDRAIRAIYREIMSASLALEEAIRVAYLGPLGTFTHMAARAKFGDSVEYIPTRDILGIFRAVASRAADVGVVPVENSIDGGVADTLDAFMSFDVQICSELLMEVHHCLMAPRRDTGVHKIYSKPQVFAQCGRWLGEHYPDADLMSVSSTARACEVAREEENAAAIAHSSAAAMYGLEILHHNIEDVASNVTRFVVLGQESCKPSDHDKTSLVLSVVHKAGALYAALEPFRDNGLNLTRIESRPSKRNPWEYYFFIDFEGHRDDEAVQQTLQKVQEVCNYLQILGSYSVAQHTVTID